MVIALPALVAVAVAALALLLYYGTDKFGQVLIKLTPDISFPGIGSLRDVTTVAVDAGVGLVRRLLYPVVHPIVELTGAAATWAIHIIGGGVAAAQATAGAIHRLLTVVIPHRLDMLRAHIMRHVAAIAAGLSARIVDLRADVHDWITATRAYAARAAAAALSAALDHVHALRLFLLAEISDLRSWTAQRVAAVAAAAAHDIAALRTWTGQRIAGVQADLADAVDALGADIVAAEAHAIHVVDVDLWEPLQDLWTGALADVAALEGVIATDFPDIRELLDGIDVQRIIDLVGVGGLSLVLSRVAVRYMRSCGIPNCRNLSAIGRDLAALLDLIGDASLLALFAEMILHPEQAAHEVQGVLGGLARPFAGTVRELIGV